METNNIQIVPIEETEDKGLSFNNFGRFFKRCLRNWYWIALSVILCCGIAAYYILSTAPTYTRSAEVLIKEAATRRMATSDIESVLSFSGGSSMSSKVVNEVIAFKSPALMQEAVIRLGLNTQYKSKGLLRDNVIYMTQVPVEAVFVDVPSNYSVSLTISKADDETLSVGDFKYFEKGEKYKLEGFQAHVGDTVSTPIGRIAFLASEYYMGEWKKPVIVSHCSVAAATARFRAAFKAEPMDVKNKADVIRLVCMDSSVQRADDILNTIINIYNESWVEDKNRMAISTSEFIDDRLRSLEKELGDVDDEISEYKSKNLLPDMNVVSSIYLTQTQETGKMAQELNNQIAVFKYVKNYLATNPGTENLIPLSASMSSSAVVAQVTEYNKTLLTRNNIRANSSDNNPLVMDMTNSLIATRKAIESAIDNQIETFSVQIDNIRQLENSNNNRIAQSPTQAKYLLSVGRQQKVKESLYLYLLQKREENELSQAFTAYNTRVITPPMGIARPSSPRKMQIMLLALIFGLFLPVFVIYIIEIADTKVRSKKDIESLTLPSLGEIPQYDKHSGLKKAYKKGVNPEIVVRHGVRDIVNEAFRVYRTNLEFMTRGADCPVVITTSFNPGSGKTFISINSASALAVKGKKVLVVDADLRRSSLSEYAGKPKKGLSDFLSGDVADVNSVIIPVPGVPNLSMLPVGTVPPNPTELICLPEFPSLIESLKQSYDFIIIDCPPVDIVADTQIIEECADRTVFVIRAGVLDRKDVPALQKTYDSKRFKNLCYVFNGVESTASYYGHYGSYGSYGNA